MKKLTTITTQYSKFSDNQVLTKGQLNEFLDYFEDQDHLSRTALSGVGIVCGFKVIHNTTTKAISIGKGFGITTDGDLITLMEQIPVEENETQNRGLQLLSEDYKTYTHYSDFQDNKANYKPFFYNEASQIKLFEIFAESEIDVTTGSYKNLNELEGLADKVVLLYLENYPKEGDLCTALDCDNQGIEQIARLRVLLVSSEDAVTIASLDTLFTKHNIYEKILSLPQMAVQRVVLNGNFGGNNNISSYDKLAVSYKSKITAAKNSLKKAYNDFFEGFSNLLGITDSSKNAILKYIDELDNFTDLYGVQYRYSQVINISDTFNEILNLLLKLKEECSPDINAFPKHLLLGRLESVKEYPELRHDFYYSPTHNTNNVSLTKKVNSLINRVQLLLKNFNLKNTNGIVITPSKKSGELGGKAIPVYYDVDKSLLKHWDFEKTFNYKQGYNLSYHKTNLSLESWVQNPLNYEVPNLDFYRIEGYLGENPDKCVDVIDSIKIEKGLDFDSLVFNLDLDSDAFASFVKKHPSISYKAGVEKGGTFILLSNSNKVVADFCISYKIKEQEKEQGCCSLMECTFPWISSLKYLNNLSRSIKGTQSRNKFMPKDYVLDVIEYKINGVPLISRTTRINIPLNQIFLRRMHAITDALNTRFSNGVVFDFNESQKRFVITRAKEDNYVIRLRDATLGGNPIYTYSNSGMFRENKVFRPDAMRCRSLKGHNAAFYEKLHASIAPINKDDDYGTYNDKWAKWYALRDKLINNKDIRELGLTRMITSAEQLPKEIRSSISKIKTDFGLTREFNFQLDGDWVNGLWVDNLMLSHHKKNRKNTHDDIVLFVNLRKLLHNETGVTKLSIYITGTNYSEEFDSIIERYKTIADFYFGSPSGENAIQI